MYTVVLRERMSHHRNALRKAIYTKNKFLFTCSVLSMNLWIWQSAIHQKNVDAPTQHIRNAAGVCFIIQVRTSSPRLWEAQVDSIHELRWTAPVPCADSLFWKEEHEFECYSCKREALLAEKPNGMLLQISGLFKRPKITKQPYLHSFVLYLVRKFPVSVGCIHPAQNINLLSERIPLFLNSWHILYPLDWTCSRRSTLILTILHVSQWQVCVPPARTLCHTPEINCTLSIVRNAHQVTTRTTYDRRRDNGTLVLPLPHRIQKSLII